MMSLSQIVELSDEAARKAGAAGRKPYLLRAKQSTIYQINAGVERHLPFIGSLRYEDWKLVKTYFVDSSGWGQVSEAALTIGEFRRELKANVDLGLDLGYAVVEAGQFQVVIGAFLAPDASEAMKEIVKDWEV